MLASPAGAGPFAFNQGIGRSRLFTEARGATPCRVRLWYSAGDPTERVPWLNAGKAYARAWGAVNRCRVPFPCVVLVLLGLSIRLYTGIDGWNLPHKEYAMNEVVAAQLERNYTAFKQLEASLLAEHSGRVALLHDGALVEIYNDAGDAYAIGCEKFGLGNFTTQRIGATAQSLGSSADMVFTLQAGGCA